MADTQTEPTPAETSVTSWATLVPGAELLPKPPAASAAPAVTETQTEETPETTETTVVEGGTPGEGEEGTPAEGAHDDLTTFDETRPVAELIGTFKKRIGTVTARRREAEESANALRGQVAAKDEEIARLRAEKGAPAVAVSAEDPLAWVQTPEQLQEAIANASRYQEMAIRNPDGFTWGEGDKAIDLTPEQVRDLQAKALAILTVHAPRRGQYLATTTAKNAEVQAVYPDLFDSTKPDYKEAQNLLNVWPELRRFPDYMEVIGDYLRGSRARIEAAKKPTQGTEAVKPPAKKPVPPVAPPVPRATGAPPIPAKEARKERAMEQAITSGGDVNSIAGFFAAARGA